MKVLMILLVALTSVFAHSSTVTEYYDGPITGIRVESDVALISMIDSFQEADPPCNRVWLNLKLEEHQAAYSLFMMAFVSDMDIRMRARTASTERRLGACILYDVFVPRQ